MVLPPRREWVAYSLWLFEYFNNYIGTRHGDNLAEQYAVWTLKNGAQVLPNFAKKAEEARAWVARGMHLKPETYKEALAEIMKIMEYPLVPQFVAIGRSTGGTDPQVITI